ncbi:MAG: hypothetical protein ACFFCE_00355 [Promethearchaeota archaeon]
MKLYNEIQENEDITNDRLLKNALFSHNFHKIPPIIGIITADQYGNTLMVFQYEEGDESNYNPIKSYLSEDDKSLLDIDLISMYFSSFKTFAGQTNIQNLSNLEIHGSNIKIQIYFLFDKYMIIIFLNSNTELNLKDKAQIVHYFEEQLINHEFEFKYFNATDSRNTIRKLEKKGKTWLKKLNVNYRDAFKNIYLKKHEMINFAMEKIAPIIQEELIEYFSGIPEDIVNNVTKEIRNKIQDKFCEFNSKLLNSSLLNLDP